MTTRSTAMIEAYFLVESMRKGDKNGGNGKNGRNETDGRMLIELLLFDLDEVELDWGFAAENSDQDLELAFLFIDGVDEPFVVFEGAIGDDDLFADAEVDLKLRLLFLDVFLDHVEFFWADGDWDCARPDESGDIGGIADDVPAFICDDHLDEDVPWEEAFFLGDVFTFFDGNSAFLRDDDIKDEVVHVERLDTLAESLFYGIFVTGISMDDIPVPARAFRLFTDRCFEAGFLGVGVEDARRGVFVGR